MQAVTWYDKLEVLVMLTTFGVGVATSADTDPIVESAEEASNQLTASKTNAERALELSRTQMRQAREMSDSVFRPNIFAAFESPNGGGQWGDGRKIFLVVRNVGTESAFNIRLRFEPELVSSVRNYSLQHLHSLLDDIPSLAPATSIGHAFDHVLEIRKAEVLPLDEYVVWIEYTDSEGGSFSVQQSLSMRPYTAGGSGWRFIERIDARYPKSEKEAKEYPSGRPY